MDTTQTPTDLALLHELVAQLPSLCGELDGKIEAATFPVMKRELAIWNNIVWLLENMLHKRGLQQLYGFPEGFEGGAVEAMLAVGCEIQAMFVVAKRQLFEWKLLVDKLEGNGTNDYDPKDPKTLPKPFRRVFCPLKSHQPQKRYQVKVIRKDRPKPSSK